MKEEEPSQIRQDEKKDILAVYPLDTTALSMFQHLLFHVW